MRRVEKLNGTAGAAKVRGAAVVVDVVFSATTAACALYSGVTEIYPCFSILAAKRLRAKLGDPVIFAEKSSFGDLGDYDNSPSQALNAKDTAGRSAILLSTAGCPCLHFCSAATSILFASLTTLTSTVRTLQGADSSVAVVAASETDKWDSLCCRLIADALLDKKTIAQRHAESERRALPQFHCKEREADFEIALSKDAFSFTLEARRRDGELIVVMV